MEECGLPRCPTRGWDVRLWTEGRNLSVGSAHIRGSEPPGSGSQPVALGVFPFLGQVGYAATATSSPTLCVDKLLQASRAVSRAACGRVEHALLHGSCRGRASELDVHGCRVAHVGSSSASAETADTGQIRSKKSVSLVMLTEHRASPPPTDAEVWAGLLVGARAQRETLMRARPPAGGRARDDDAAG